MKGACRRKDESRRKWLFPEMMSFFYFLQLLYNWPRVLMITWNNSWNTPEKPMEHVVKIVWSSGDVWNSADDELLTEVRIETEGAPAQFRYQIFDDTEILYKDVVSSEPELVLKINPARNYHLKLFKNNIQVASQKFPSFWLAAIGDSFSSGQGNPAPTPPKWLDELCYRSSSSFVYQVYQKIAQKCSLFTFLSCSGASVDHGILSKNGQMEKLSKMIEKRGAPPDVLLLTIGGNDIGFTDILSQIQEGAQLDTASEDMRFFYVFHQLDRIGQRLAELQIPKIVLPTYYDITRNEDGEIDASCGLFGEMVSRVNLMVAERRILRRLNDLLRRKAEKYGWITVDTTDIFRRRGLCSSKSLIRSRNESIHLQGNEYGSFHPNREGHRLISQKIVEILT